MDMKIGKMQAFPNPIMYMSLGEDSRSLNQSLLTDLMLEAEQNLNHDRSGVGVGQTNGNLENHYESFATLKRTIDTIFKEVGNDFFGINGEPNSKVFWGNLDDNPYGYHMPHAHKAKEMIAGVYFPSSGWYENENISDTQDLDEGVLIKSASQPEPGDLSFLDPIHFAKTPVIMKDNVQRYPFFGNPICVTPKEGTLVLFPCWLPHMVSPTAKPGFTRVSIAFGIDFD